MIQAGRVAIIGAGFSGLTLAWALSKKNIQVEIFEQKEKAGGLISSMRDQILIETAANAILANGYVEDLAQDLNIELLSAGYKSNKRWIYREIPRQLPLKISEILGALKNFLKAKICKKLTPLEAETVAQWGERCLGAGVVKYLISPALQGIYGTQAENLSAKLVIAPLLQKNNKIKKAKLKGSVSPANGMQDWINGLEIYLQAQDVKIHYNSKINLVELQSEYQAVVVATSHLQAAQILKNAAPKLSQLLQKVPALPIASVVMGFKSERNIKGFGCLFPRDQNFNSLGVLFNTDIFANRGELESETWILASPPQNQKDCLGVVLQDRKRFLGSDENPCVAHAKIWPQALPLYGFELKDVLFSDQYKKNQSLTESIKPIYLTGNYLGALGLGKILVQNIELADAIEKGLV